MNRVIIIMAKVPRAGNVKTRLQPFLSPEQCRLLTEALLADAVNKAHPLCDKLIIAFAPAHEKDYFAAFNLKNLILAKQQGADLGDKISNAFEFAFENVSDASFVMIGTDSPTFPPEFIEKAFEHLEEKSEIVLGKAADGGFYLIGLRAAFPALFENIEWSSPLVYEQISRNIERLNLKFQSVPDWYDIDEPEDLRRIYMEAAADTQMALIAPATCEWLLSNAAIFSRKPDSF